MTNVDHANKTKSDTFNSEMLLFFFYTVKAVYKGAMNGVCFVDRCLSLCTFSFGRCVVCSSSIYGF